MLGQPNHARQLNAFLRRKKRRVLEEDEEIDEKELQRDLKEYDFMHEPGSLDLAEDTTGTPYTLPLKRLQLTPWLLNHVLSFAGLCCLTIWSICLAFLLFAYVLPDPTILIEADGMESGKKQLKTMTWPLMDSDALASSYITKVLTCLSKWRVKLQGLQEVVGSMESADQTKEGFTEFLCLQNC